MAGGDAAAAGARRAEGNARFAAGEHQDALREYEAALLLLPEEGPEAAGIHNNMAAVHLKLRQASAAAEQSRRALRHEPGNAKARSRLVRATAATGDFLAALRALEEHPERHGALEDLRAELQAAEAALAAGDAELEAGRFGAALETFGQLEEGLLFDCPRLVARMGRCYLAQGEVSRALHVSTSLLRADGADVEALLLRAEAQLQSVAEGLEEEAWQQGAEAALQTARKALQLDPEHKAAARLRRWLRSCADLARHVRDLLGQGDWRSAEEALTGVLRKQRGEDGAVYGRLAARCHAVRGRARLEMEDLEGCLADCRAASKMDDRLASAPVCEASALQKLERWEEAVAVLEGLHTWKKDEDTFWKVEWAKFEVRRVKRPDYYAILGISRDASQADVKSAYRRQSVEMHPDKQLRRNPDVDMKEARDQFQMIGEAFEILGTEAKREYYDKGYDAQGIRECLQVRKRFQGQAPCTVCGEDESGKFGADKRWYCHACWDRFYRENPQDEHHPDRRGAGATGSSAPAPGERPQAAASPSASSGQPRRASWPEDSLLPTDSEVEAMGVPELRAVLQKMGVEAVGCFTKEDLRACALGHLGRLRGRPPGASGEAAVSGAAAASGAAAGPGQQPPGEPEPAAAPGGRPLWRHCGGPCPAPPAPCPPPPPAAPVPPPASEPGTAGPPLLHPEPPPAFRAPPERAVAGDGLGLDERAPREPSGLPAHSPGFEWSFSMPDGWGAARGGVRRSRLADTAVPPPEPSKKVSPPPPASSSDFEQVD